MSHFSHREDGRNSWLLRSWLEVQVVGTGAWESEPLTCGMWCYVPEGSVRIKLSCRILVGIFRELEDTSVIEKCVHNGMKVFLYKTTKGPKKKSGPIGLSLLSVHLSYLWYAPNISGIFILTSLWYHSTPYLHFARLLLFLLVPGDCNCCKVLDDTLRVHCLSSPRFSTVN